MNLRNHWNSIYLTKSADAVSWYQPRPQMSLDLILASGIRKDAGILDVGGGESTLVDGLLEAGYGGLGVLDVSLAALDRARSRLGARAAEVEWFEADVTSFQPPRRFGLWHDRAVFHFLTDALDRTKYVSTLRETLLSDGHVVIAAFAPDGPAMCSGLDVMRHDEHSIAAELGAEFELCDAARELHRTPWGAGQQFVYARFRRHAHSE